MNIIVSQMCLKCDVMGTNYSLPNSDYDPIIIYRTVGHVAGSDLNSFYQARTNGRTLILMPVLLI